MECLTHSINQAGPGKPSWEFLRIKNILEQNDVMLSGELSLDNEYIKKEAAEGLGVFRF